MLVVDGRPTPDFSVGAPVASIFVDGATLVAADAADMKALWREVLGEMGRRRLTVGDVVEPGAVVRSVGVELSVSSSGGWLRHFPGAKLEAL